MHSLFIVSQGLHCTGPATGTQITRLTGIEKHLHVVESRNNNQP